MSVGRHGSSRSDQQPNIAAHSPRSTPARQDLLALLILAAFALSSSVMLFKINSLPSRVSSIIESQNRQGEEQLRQGRELRKLIMFLQNQVEGLPTDIPAPEVTVRQQPGRTVVIVSSPKPQPSNSSSPSPSPSPSEACVIHNPNLICRPPKKG